MSLFSYADLNGQKAQPSKAVLSSFSATSSASLRRRDEVADAIAQLDHGQCMHFVSTGQWSMHELLEEMLQKTGPAHVHITTWTLTEDPVRRIVMMKEEGLIKSLHCLLDYRIRDRKPAPFQLLQNNADRIALASCHAKVTVLQNDIWGMVCLGSANYSRNPRFEAGIVSASKDDAQFHIEWIKQAIENAKQ